MDIVREDIAKEKRRRRIIIGAAGVAAILLITLGLSRLKPAAPTVDKSTVWIDSVKRGPMERQVRGPGSLVPETEGIRQISSSTDARVERLLVQAGAPVQPDTVLLEMSNPELERDTLDADWQLKARVTGDLVARGAPEGLWPEAVAAAVESDFARQSSRGGQSLQGGPRRGLDSSSRTQAASWRPEQSKAPWRSPSRRRRSWCSQPASSSHPLAGLKRRG
jgi:multidrug efflux pump subunit AcrA (membrane-fusion protein)